MKIILLLIGFMGVSCVAAADPAKDLKEVEAKLKESPDDPMLHTRKSQLLFASGKEQAAIDHAAVALEKFKLAGDDLAWIKLGSIETDRFRVDVHFNLGPRERAEKKDGIVRPYSFRIYDKGDPPQLVQILDFEIGYYKGKASTAAIGEMIRGGHANYGIVDPKSKFSVVKKKVLNLIASKK
ncbi:MAG: hypothetical protein AAFV88_12535 [Planctomycetota bacterium]